MTSTRGRALALTSLVASAALVLAACAGTTPGTGGSSSSATSGGVCTTSASARPMETSTPCSPRTTTRCSSLASPRPASSSRPEHPSGVTAHARQARRLFGCRTWFPLPVPHRLRPRSELVPELVKAVAQALPVDRLPDQAMETFPQSLARRRMSVHVGGQARARAGSFLRGRRRFVRLLPDVSAICYIY